MKDMKAYVLHLGEAYVESTYFVRDDTAATVANPNAPHRLLRNPFTAILVDHPEAGWILYDTGIPDNWEDIWTKKMLATIAVKKPAHTSMEHQLGLVGITPKDVKHVIISHLHMDHTGNVKLFEDANFYVAKEDMAFATLNLLAMNEEQYQDNFFWIKEEVFCKVKSRNYIDRDEEQLFPGIDIITLPGHTPCVLGMVVHLKNQPIIAVADAINVIENYNGQVPGAMYDSLGYLQSLRKIKDLEKKYGAKVLFGHDINQLENEVKIAPEFYD